MADIRHRVGINAPAERVYEALSTIDGVRGWWSSDAEGDAGPGGRLRFSFGAPEPIAEFEVVDATPTSHVAWKCLEGPGEWVGTTVDFALKAEGDETVIVFTHRDWPEPVEFMHHCSTKWAVFLLGMKTWLEGGESSTYPKDPHISSWG